MALESHNIKRAMAGGVERSAVLMMCSERERLLRSYHTAVSSYANIVSELKNADRSEFPKRFALADAARERCDRLRETIERHRREHGC